MIKVLIVDNSLYMRALLSTMLDGCAQMKVVGTANNGQEALQQIQTLHPDVVTLDLVMPGWDGLTTLTHIMAQCPTPVVIVSAHSEEGAAVTLQCLHAGAVSAVLKPSGELSLDIAKIKMRLMEEIQSAARVRVTQITRLIAQRATPRRQRFGLRHRVIVMGASTGGPQTLEAILPALPGDLPCPVIVAQHVPSPYFTRALAERLNGASEAAVQVARHGEVLRAGTVYLAPHGFHTIGRAARDETTLALIADTAHVLSPSVDATMQSLAQCYGEGTVGVILTGMGRDGLQGMRAIKETHGVTIAEDASAIMFGMPREVINAGLADQALPSERIAEAIVAAVTSEAELP